MAYNSQQFLFCANARIRVNDVGVEPPKDFTTPFEASFKELGFIDEKGVQVDDAKTLTDIKSAQSFYPTMKMISDKKHTLQFNLQEWTKASVSLAFGGGKWVTDGGVAKFTPPDPSFLDNRQLVIDWTVNSYNWRWVVFKGIVSSNIQTSLAKTSEALLPITFEALGQSQMGGGTALPWAIYTDDPEFATAGA